ncbi:MAG TPA: HIT family protein [Candidatus Nanoarchaeia archaeon]|nr:HIT family protein [Candidatus Nanoarchaeia archaeon]
MDCVFCSLVGQRELFTGESEHFFSVRDIHPKSEGHTVVILKEHCAHFGELDFDLGNEFLEFVQDCVQKLGCESYNLVVNTGSESGQVISHFHLHIIPRRKADGVHL